MSDVKILIEAIENKRCILFLGAGVHYPPPENSPYQYPPEHRPPLGDKFSCQLADECLSDLKRESDGDVLDVTGMDDETSARSKAVWTLRGEERAKQANFLTRHRTNLQRTSWYYEVHPGRGPLIDKIIAAVDTGREPSPIVLALAEMDFPIIITTNYDRLFEKALRAHKKEPQIRVYDPEGSQPTRDFKGEPDLKAPWLFKMHGCVSDPNSIVVTDEDYIQFAMRTADSEDFRPMALNMRVKFKEWTTLFVGYSLLDYNLRLLFRTLRRRLHIFERPATFSLDPFPDLLVLATYGARAQQGASAPLVSFIEQDSWKFVPELYRRLFKRPML